MGAQRTQTSQSTVLVTRRLIVIAAAVSLTAGLAAGAAGAAITGANGSATATNAAFAAPGGQNGMGGANTMTYDYSGTYSGEVNADGTSETTSGEHATFHAVDSTLSSAIASGSMFYFTNTAADVVLSNVTLDFDSSKATLINASGNDSNNWGSAGSNGATITFTGRDQRLEGDVTADTISSVDLYLLEGSTWTGAASITDNAAASSGSGTLSDAPISVNVDGTSTWVVTGDTTVSALNVASGGKVVDASGRTVTIVAGGKTVVSGTSDVTVTVTGSYATNVEAGDDTQLAADTVDRSAYDDRFGTDTAWSL